MDLENLAGNPEQIKQLIFLLSSMLPKDQANVADQDPPEEPESVIKTKKVRQDKKRYVNKFLAMPESKMHKDDVEIDKKLQRFPPTARNRESTLVEVTCRVCGKTEEIASLLASESRGRYKCNQCSTSPG
jgi:hypothetical protein